MVPATQNAVLSHTNGVSANRLGPFAESFFGDLWPALNARQGMPRPVLPISFWEDEHAIHIEMDAPGMAEEDIDLSLENGLLTLRGERKSERREGAYDSRSYGRFQQQLRLPSTIDANTIEARLSRGVLRVTCLKSEAAKPRKISVTMDG